VIKKKSIFYQNTPTQERKRRTQKRKQMKGSVIMPMGQESLMWIITWIKN